MILLRPKQAFRAEFFDELHVGDRCRRPRGWRIRTKKTGVDRMKDEKMGLEEVRRKAGALNAGTEGSAMAASTKLPKFHFFPCLFIRNYAPINTSFILLLYYKIFFILIF